MEERKLNEKESLELITQMIINTRSRFKTGNGNVYLLWGYTSVAIAILIYIIGFFSTHPAWNFLWFLIWIIGGTLPNHVQKKQKETPKSYTDRLTEGLWSIAGYCAIVATVLCLYFMLAKGADCWSLMMIFGLFVIGFATSMQGVILKEQSLIVGGGVGMLSGAYTMCCLIIDIPLLSTWFTPLFILTFICMMIVPGHIINRKAKKTCSKN
ncbi:MAG: hypothetical protein IJY59_06730 [Bacteroidaceae bacterium]|nr:hypothetical protein [Bacteroidaceae bacterium]